MDDLNVWLENLGLGKYADAFANHDFGPDVLDLLKEIHLKELGVSLGDRLRLVKAISAELGQATETVASAAALPLNVPLAAPVSSSDAERRPLTVMFCDLADSTALSTRLDPEDLQDVIRGYQETCTRLIQEYEGFVAKSPPRSLAARSTPVLQGVLLMRLARPFSDLLRGDRHQRDDQPVCEGNPPRHVRCTEACC